ARPHDLGVRDSQIRRRSRRTESVRAARRRRRRNQAPPRDRVLRLTAFTAMVRPRNAARFDALARRRSERSGPLRRSVLYAEARRRPIARRQGLAPPASALELRI